MVTCDLVERKDLFCNFNLAEIWLLVILLRGRTHFVTLIWPCILGVHLSRCIFFTACPLCSMVT